MVVVDKDQELLLVVQETHLTHHQVKEIMVLPLHKEEVVLEEQVEQVHKTLEMVVMEQHLQ